MILAEKKILLFGTLILLIIAMMVPCETSTLHRDGFDKVKYKKTKALSDKNFKHKEYESVRDKNTESDTNQGNESRYELERIEQTEVLNTTEVRAQLSSPDLKESDLKDGLNRKIHETKRTHANVNRLRRNIDEPASIGLSYTTTSTIDDGFKSGKKNYKKFKFMRSQVDNEDAKTKTYLWAQRQKCYSNSKYVRENKINRRHVVYPATSLFKLHRSRRDAVFSSGRPLRANATDYYAQRKAVMERFYARQREIAAKYAKKTTTAPTTVITYDLNTNLEPTSAFSKTVQDRGLSQNTNISRNIPNGQQYLYATENRLIYPENREEIERMTPKINFTDTFKPDLEPFTSSDIKNVERDTSNYYTPPTKCENISLSGSFAPKKRIKESNNCSDSKREDIPDSGNTESSNDHPSDTGSDNQRWGVCEGKVVYQHNLLLGLKGSSNLDTKFEVIIQGPLCISCVEALRYNKTRAAVSLHSGGRGYDFAKLNLKGYKNEGFSHIVKIWGVKKTGDDCRNMLQ